MKKFIKEFKAFALKGNMMDMAVAVIIGGAFTGIINSLIDNLITPLLDFILAGERYTSQQIGSFVSAFLAAILNFFLMALVLFILVKSINKMMSLGKKKEAPAPTTKKCKYCQSDIPVKATRCPYCTSILEDEADEKKSEV